MIILGIDPGIATTGYGLIASENGTSKWVDSGTILTSKNRSPEERLGTIYRRLISIINKHRPDCCVIEQLFFNTNAKTALGVGQARGTVLLAAQHNNLKCFEYTPLQVKQAVVGYGRADKKQVQYMVKQILRLDRQLKNDEADALAVAICHVHSYRWGVEQLRTSDPLLRTKI